MGPTRPISRQTDKGGMHYGIAQGTPKSDTTRLHLPAPPPNVIPIVFIPGVMGSNLKAVKEIKLNGAILAKAGKPVWNVNSSTSAAGWTLKNPAERQMLLNKDVLTVDDRGDIALKTFGRGVRRTAQSMLPLELAQARGWGTVSWAFYGPFLDWLHHQLNNPMIVGGEPNDVLAQLLALDGKTPPGAAHRPAALAKDQIRKLMKYQFPVWAVGYNWLQSNLDSGKDVLKIINEKIIPDARKNNHRCEQVILVTHSMGGLVARAVAKQAGNAVLGVVHGVQPLDGAAAFYKRLAAGFASEGGGIKGWIQSLALGSTARDTTPVIAYAPGPLELAPNQRYNGGKPWLFVRDTHGKILKALPQSGDPYKEIYADSQSAWRAINPEWLNPAGISGKGLVDYAKTVKVAKGYHTQLGGYVHPQTYAHYSNDTGHKAWGTVTWSAESGAVYQPTPLQIGLGVWPVPRWLPGQPRPLAAPATWRLTQTPTDSERFAHDAHGALKMNLLPAAEPGDGTVPASASAGQVGTLAGCQIACGHSPGYEHSASYALGEPHSSAVQHTVLDAVIRLTGHSVI